MREIKNIIIHCADTPTGKPYTAADIDSWHIERGFQRQQNWREYFNSDLRAIGYHYVIYLDGSIHTGRHVNEIGAHCAGLNSGSIGICLIGRGEYTTAQWDALADLCNRLLITYPAAQIIGHYQTPSGQAQGKKCPDFPVPAWLTAGKTALPGHVVA